MIEFLVECDARHEPIEGGGDRRPFGMPFADPLFGVDFQVYFLVFPQFGYQNIVVYQLHILELLLLVPHRHPLQILRIHAAVHQVLFRLQIL